MAPSTTSEKITLTYPLFSAAFVDADRLVVSGGGGEGRSGVGNTITVLDVSKSSTTQSQMTTNIKQLSEHTLSPSEDSCMTLAVAHSPHHSKKSSPKHTIAPTLLAGINSSEESLLAGKNEHFRVFSFSPTHDAISPVSRTQLFTQTFSKMMYQRVLRARGSLAALANGGGDSGFEVVVVNTTGEPAVQRRIATDSEVADLDLADDGTLVYCTGKDIFTMTPTPTTTAAPQKLAFQPTPLIPGSFRSVRFLTRDRIVAVLNAPQRTGSELLLLDTTTGSLITRRALHSGIKAVTGIDAVELGGGSGAVAVAGADQSIEILVVENGTRIKRARLFRNVHPFQISKVAFSPPPRPTPAPAAAAVVADVVEKVEEHVIRLATTSIGNTVVVHTLPLIALSSSGATGFALLRSGAVARQTAISVLLSLFAVVVMALLLQVVFVARGGLTGLQGFSKMLPPLSGINLDGTREAVQADVDALIQGLRSGAASDPFGEDGIMVDEEAIAEDLLKKEEAGRKEEL